MFITSIKVSISNGSLLPGFRGAFTPSIFGVDISIYALVISTIAGAQARARKQDDSTEFLYLIGFTQNNKYPDD